MYTNKQSIMVRLMAMLMVIVLMVPVCASAAAPETVQPYASSYLDGYGAYVYLPGDGEVQVYFDVSGTGYMDELGVLTIEIWESTNNATWTWKKSFTHDSTSGMLSYNDNFHSGHVSYNGVAGRYYKAYVCVWGGKNGNGDTRYFWTSVKH